MVSILLRVRARRAKKEKSLIKISKNSVPQRGFLAHDILIVMVLIGILASLAFARFMGVRDRGFIVAAQYDLVHLRAALAIHAADHDGYPEALASLEELKQAAVDRNGNPTMILPSGQTFLWLSYDLQDDLNYLLRIQALDREHTILEATGDGVSR